MTRFAVTRADGRDLDPVVPPQSSSFPQRYWLRSLFTTVVVIASAGFCAVAQTSTAGQVNCSDPAQAMSTICRAATSDSTQRTDTVAPDTSSGAFNPATDLRRNQTSPLYVDSAGTEARRRTTTDERREEFLPPDPPTDFQRLVRSSTGEDLPIFGRDLFQRAPSTFAPADQLPAASDYVIGPGDQLLVRLWGPETFNSQLTVDTSGAIYIPKVGSIQVAGLRYDQLQQQLNADIGRIYRNFNLSVNLGRLRSIQVYVVGEARRPGAFTVSSLSTVLNALFVSGGPNAQGSLRHIQVRRGGQPAMEFDLYDFILRGDKSKDVRLEQGDTIFVPAVSAQVALSGSVRHPAIYELRGESTLADILQYAGGFSSTAATENVSLERIDRDHTRKALMLRMDGEGKTLPLRDGDVLFVNHISNAYETSVTIRGNLANPGRFPFHPGMRLSEIIPDRRSLLTIDYWRERNRLGVPVPLFEPLPRTQILYGSPAATSPSYAGAPEATRQMRDAYDQVSDQSALQSQAQRATASNLALQSSQLPPTGASASLFNPPDSPAAAVPGDATSPLGANSTGTAPLPRAAVIQNRINIPTAEIDWSYAVIERLDPNTLKNLLLPFNLGKLVQDHDPAQDLELQPGDVVTILSQADITVPLDEQTKFVRLEGEFVSAGVYSVHAGETLGDVVRRAGGLTPKAYLYGSSFFRESARVFQQQRLDEYITTLSVEMERAAAVRAASTSTGILDPNALAQQRALVSQLRQLRSTGRVVFEFLPASASLDAIPQISLENGDVFRVPSRPNTVSVIGAVYGQNVFLYNSSRRVEDYVALAGKPNRVADRSHAFIIRADGSIYSRERAQGIWSNNFNSARINPGDSIVIPEKPIRPTVLKQLTDYSQILSSFGLAAAAINVIR